MKVLTVVGARPQFIKAAVVSRAIKNTADIEEILVHTGQHYDANMSDLFFSEMEISKPSYNLNISGGSHGLMTGRMLSAIEEILIKENPDIVLVYGDTNSTLAGALAASKLCIPVAHVEAGLRSFNMSMPEEVNRILTDRISNLLFCPTQTAINNLRLEGYDSFRDKMIFHVGDVMLDAALYYQEKSVEKSVIISKLGLQRDNFVLCTIHRQENVDNEDRLSEIVRILNKCSKECRMIISLHPRTKSKLVEFNLNFDFPTIAPVGYFDMIQLISNAKMIMTDSGGLQKEAFFFKKPCLTLRDDTEWVELVEHGCNRLCGISENAIISGCNDFFQKKPDFSASFYGTGCAGKDIVGSIKNFFIGK
jgi:UDP-GlcNAc3NAcA epimerase